MARVMLSAMSCALGEISVDMRKFFESAIDPNRIFSVSPEGVVITGQ